MVQVDVARYGPWCLIAGGSEGIGAAFATDLAARGLNLILAARREEPLAALAGQIRRAHPVEVRTLAVDLTAEDALARVVAASDDVEVGLLVYNAGAVPWFRSFHDMTLDEALLMARLNVIGQTTLAWHFGRRMRERGRGGIILLSSTAYASGIGHLATYAAAKAHTQILAEGLWYELRPHGVDVLAVAATTTRTPAVQKMGMPLDDPAYPSVEPEQVVAESLAALGREPVHHMAGSEAIARGIATMPRREAIELVSRAIGNVFPRPEGATAA